MYGYDYTRLTPIHVLWLIAVPVGISIGWFLGALVGIWINWILGDLYFDYICAVAGGILGFLIAHIAVGCLHGSMHRSFMRELDSSSNAELRALIAKDDWKFIHTMALLHLAARNEDVRCELPRILAMLESDSELSRRFGWDALRIVFSQETAIIPDYNPRATAEACRNKVADLRRALETGSPLGDQDSSAWLTEAHRFFSR